jgi:DNA-directed RNA polymerase subunit RPC12/RpoP
MKEDAKLKIGLAFIVVCYFLSGLWHGFGFLILIPFFWVSFLICKYFFAHESDDDLLGLKCPHCMKRVKRLATRCPHCTSHIKESR